MDMRSPSALCDRNVPVSTSKKGPKSDDTSVVNPFTGHGYTTKMEPLTLAQEQIMRKNLLKGEAREESSPTGS